jgi:ABC-2 type transport system ATP-binding protein
VIEIKNLRKEYGAQVAIENLSLEIPEGEVYGMIGPNGAGKTTMIRILATLLEPTFGTVKIAGIDVVRDPLRVHPILGYMSDFFALYENMLVWEYLDHFARCYDVPRDRRQALIDQALDLVDLNVRKESEVKALSRGMRQRLCFAKTLLHEPKVLLLDEPASGLDPKARYEFRELVKKLHEMGRTVLISSHILNEMDDFCTSVGIFEKGKLVTSGRVGDILRQMQSALVVEVESLDGEARILEILGASPHAEQPERSRRGVQCRWHGPREELPALHRALVSAEIEVVSFAVRSDDLEDLYMRLSKHETA